MHLDNLHLRLTGVLPLLARRPDLLDAVSQDSLLGLMVEFVGGNLCGNALALAQRLVDEDDEALEIYRELTPLPATAAPPELAELFTRALREFYTGLARPLLLAAPTDPEIREEVLHLGHINCILRLSKRPDGRFNAEFVIPEEAVADSAALSSWEIRIVDRPQPLVFQRRRSGNLVATQVLPATIGDATKQIVIVSHSEPS
jgi:hypothetical protein